ncbi:hypothetical protein [Xanthomonas vesicatoria]|uniref:hypothetical protein n=1 Tax=Xanthomonas vesicatoria TaxID=56460 RepID=UPI000A8B3C1A|nr:hypothetical protein [Xanthomonas vesicatoria]MCC8601823.1 hypothetical protein [Xanthomonas vesicatoria]MCC8609307.1 hypothetical protein [Xanthomonas vesicatoria]MCC8617089.1 hypothetical protein [Xanthomonas vesicatoria]MCC8630990.1 hypothetical protein [Xanthomonas vesicatoria]MCC8678025.1 hypothetical protein [Xanthomonas vesicatoria]
MLLPGCLHVRAVSNNKGRMASAFIGCPVLIATDVPTAGEAPIIIAKTGEPLLLRCNA